MYVEMVYGGDRWAATGNVADDLPINNANAFGVIDVQMTGWARRIWVPFSGNGAFVITNGTNGWTKSLPIGWELSGGGHRCAVIGSFVRFCGSLAVSESINGQRDLVKFAVLAAEKVMEADDNVPVGRGGMTASQAKAEIAGLMKPNVEVEAPLTALQEHANGPD